MPLRIGDLERAEAYGTIGLTKPGRREGAPCPSAKVQQRTERRTTSARRSDEERLTETYFVRGYGPVFFSYSTDVSMEL